MSNNVDEVDKYLADFKSAPMPPDREVPERIRNKLIAEFCIRRADKIPESQAIFFRKDRISRVG